MKIEGLEAVILQYENLVDVTKKKNYDILDYRKQEVNDFVDIDLRAMIIICLCNDNE